MLRIVSTTVALVCSVVLSGGCSFSGKSAVITKVMVDVTETQAVHLTNETRSKIKEGMTLEEVNAVVAPLLGPSGTMDNVNEDSFYELGWQDPKTNKAIVVRFRGTKVTGTAGVNIP